MSDYGKLHPNIKLMIDNCAKVKLPIKKSGSKFQSFIDEAFKYEKPAKSMQMMDADGRWFIWTLTDDGYKKGECTYG